MGTTQTGRFVFTLRGPNEDLNAFLSTLFSCIAQSNRTGDLTALIRLHLTRVWGPGWCVIQGKGLDKAVRYYKGFVATVADTRNSDEIVIFRPSSMPITERLADEHELDKKEIKVDLKVARNTMDAVLFDFERKAIGFELQSTGDISAVRLRKEITIGLGPLFHVVVSTSTIFYSLDETADQILYCSAGGSNVLSWRMLLKPAVLRERSGVSVVDAAWVGYVLIAVMVVVAVVVVRKCIECRSLQDKWVSRLRPE